MLKEHIKAILFDKDGTLIDFNHTWHPVFILFVDEISRTTGLGSDKRMKLLHALGGDEERFADSSTFANSPFEGILAIIQLFAPEFDDQAMRQTFANILATHELSAKQIGRGSETLKILIQRGYTLGVATADRKKTTEHTLSKAGILDYFTFIGTEDMVENGKPHPDLMEIFCKEHNLKPHQVAMVGDSIKDMQFARNSGAGQAVFVRSSFPDKSAEEIADLVLPDINALIN